MIDKLKNFGKAFWEFISSGIFLKNSLGMIASIIIFFLMTSFWLTCYTNHGDSFQVLDFKGMKLEEAQKKAKIHNFNLIVNDSIFLQDQAPNVIIDQHPTSTAKVKKNRTIYLKITKSTPPQVPLPALVGSYDYQEYSKKIIRKGVKAQIKERVYDAKYAENTILYLIIDGKKVTEESLEKGITVPEGSTVEFAVTERGGSFVPRPDLVCMKLEEAKFVLANYNLNVGSIIEDETVTNPSKAYIWKQVPAYQTGKDIRIGEKIDFHLTQHRPEDCPFQ